MSTLITKGLLGPKLITQGYTSAAYKYVKYNVLQIDYSRTVLQADTIHGLCCRYRRRVTNGNSDKGME